MSNRPLSWVKLEEDAYYAVLRALAINELNWEKEKLLTDLRSILHITNDQHFKFLEEVMSDKVVTRLRTQANNGDTNMNQANANSMPPPPPRQQTPAGQAKNARNHGRPTSAGPKFPPSNSPAPLRPHRLSDTGLGADKRSRSVKRSDSFELKRRSSSLKSGRGLQSMRSRGRGRRISVLPKEQPLVQAAPPRARRKMFTAEHFEKVKASGNDSAIARLFSELEAQDRAIDHHISLIDQLDDDSFAENDPARFCQMAIEELEMADESVEAELAVLQSSDDEGTQD